MYFATQADRVIVLKNGEIIENDTPANLSDIKESEFNRLSQKVNRS